MPDLERISISLEKTLARKLEGLVKDSSYENRSEFVRDLIRHELVQKEWDTSTAEVIGTVTLLYDHHQRDLQGRLTDIQHDHHHHVLATTHVHLDHHLCAEMIMLKGPALTLRKLADALRKEKGVLHAALSVGSTGKSLR